MAFNAPTASAVESADQPLQTVVSRFGAVGQSLEGIGAWQILLTLLVLSITYDQCMTAVIITLMPTRTYTHSLSHSNCYYAAQ